MNTRAPLSPILRYPGSKWKLMKKFVPLFADHDHFVSVFGGSGADLFGKPRSRLETLNDLDPHIFNFFSVVQHPGQAARLRNRVTQTPSNSQQTFSAALEILRIADADPVDAAWAMLVASWQGNGVAHPALLTTSRWSFLRKPRPSKRWAALPDILATATRRLKGVQVTRWTWQEALRRADTAKTLFMLDPPYHPETVATTPMYRHQMTVEDHAELIHAVQSVKGLVVICGYENDLYANGLRGWRQESFPVKACMATEGSRTSRTELLWLNYDENGKRLSGGNP
ncbi:MAG: DNA adenine methylase [Proteobacteria bacterium]|nr:DNA adenine methylase [Pseudomonadota bacterium]